MDQARLRKLLRDVKAGALGVDRALQQMQVERIAELEHSTLDLERALRRGFPEVVFGQGKTPDQIVEIVRRMNEAGQSVLVTRVADDAVATVTAALPRAEYNALARTLFARVGKARKKKPGIVVMTAGTSDQNVGEEAVVTAEVMGNKVIHIRDVGVAGLNRLLAHKDTLAKARVIVVVAGMEGALPSVVAGLTDCPVIGVPTSTGYGAGGEGEAALLAMLNSCATGLTVVNIDNGFGAGYAAALINR
ncbi:MAG: nickel pincer cofactor biosynthesis protein LarB [Acidobacteria bacterium]|nr:nickel pincer cofactor biosynthesis protein LarB [Acidobacteriota bacterium]NIQ30638.1 nickel pincer cofactor biosynthesis protein LarB [Acidobacteriota bacterium]NIQ85596.1 nickel pincer cofactor biosynthesis protein LarB [Acidobacteriota bacterium]